MHRIYRAGGNEDNPAYSITSFGINNTHVTPDVVCDDQTHPKLSLHTHPLTPWTTPSLFFPSSAASSQPLSTTLTSPLNSFANLSLL